MTEKEFGALFLNFSTGALDSIVVKRIIETYTVEKGRQTMANILKQPHGRSGDRAGANPLREVTTQEDKPEVVCSVRLRMEGNIQKCWVCLGTRPMTIQEYEQKLADSQLVTIDGKTW